MFDYTIATQNNTSAFRDACIRIEHAFPSAEKKKLLVDVDGSTIQTYTVGGGDIDVFDDYDVGAVYVKSAVDLKDMFS